MEAVYQGIQDKLPGMSMESHVPAIKNTKTPEIDR